MTTWPAIRLPESSGIGIMLVIKRALVGTFTMVLALGCAPPQAGAFEAGTFGPQEAAEFCAIASACFPAGGLNGAAGDFRSYCVWDLVGQAMSSEDRCLLNAGANCDAAWACNGSTYQLSGATCTMPTASCSGDTLSVCRPSDTSSEIAAYQLQVGCTTAGTHCLTSTSGSAECSFGTCSGANGSSHCVSSTTSERCFDGLVDSRDTCDAGFTCQETSMAASCVPTGDICTHDTCRGDTLVHCDSVDATTSREGDTQDCAAVGHCMIDSMGGHCEPANTDCDPSVLPTSCSGNAVRYCAADGTVQLFDCRDHGFAGCRQIGSASTVVYCVPNGIDFHI